MAELRWLDAVLGPVLEELGERSGAVFYTGRSGFVGERPLYILGLNPGGSPTRQADATIARSVSGWRDLPTDWSAYLDESWEGKPAGSRGLQPRLRHMFHALGMDLRNVPASNVVFVRSPTEAALAAEKARLLALCWPVHEAVISELDVRVVLCLGGTAGRWVRDRTGSHELIGRMSERNSRRWSSEAHLGRDGRAIVTVTHPGRADWRNPAADPTSLVTSVLDQMT